MRKEFTSLSARGMSDVGLATAALATAQQQLGCTGICLHGGYDIPNRGGEAWKLVEPT